MSSNAPLAERAKETRTASRPGPPWLLCRLCSHRITEAVAAVSFDGAHRHAFSNPAGLTFTIGVFDHAPGCVHEGEATEYYSWFPGYAWRIARCGGCRSHLGWCFECIGTPGPGEPPDFHALILDRLRAGP